MNRKTKKMIENGIINNIVNNKVTIKNKNYMGLQITDSVCKGINISNVLLCDIEVKCSKNDVYKTIIKDSNLNNSNIINLYLPHNQHGYFQNTTMQNSKIEHTFIKDTVVKKVDFSNSNIVWSSLYNISFDECNFNNCNINNVNFEQSNFYNCTFKNAYIRKVSFNTFYLKNLNEDAFDNANFDCSSYANYYFMFNDKLKFNKKEFPFELLSSNNWTQIDMYIKTNDEWLVELEKIMENKNYKIDGVYREKFPRLHIYIVDNVEELINEIKRIKEYIEK